MMMVFLLFGGFLLNKERVPLYCQWIAHLSFFSYAYEVRAHSWPLHSAICLV